MSALTACSRRQTLVLGVLLCSMANQRPKVELEFLGFYHFGDKDEATFNGNVLLVRWEKQGCSDTATPQLVMSREEWFGGWVPS
jgi:hypothetical protein